MPRPLKVFKTHIGFYDLIVAAPSMKAAAQAWGTKQSLFAQGFAAVTKDADAVEAALSEPGMVLRRPHGQSSPYKAEPDAIAVPKLTARQKRAAKEAEVEHKRRQAAEKRSRLAAERKAHKSAQKELADIEREEAELRNRRQKLQKKFHLRSVR